MRSLDNLTINGLGGNIGLNIKGNTSIKTIDADVKIGVGIESDIKMKNVIDTKMDFFRPAGTETETVEYYNGEYSVVPKLDPQILQTRNKKMIDDVVVAAVPYYITRNSTGSNTFSICNEE